MNFLTIREGKSTRQTVYQEITVPPAGTLQNMQARTCDDTALQWHLLTAAELQSSTVYRTPGYKPGHNILYAQENTAVLNHLNS